MEKLIYSLRYSKSSSQKAIRLELLFYGGSISFLLKRLGKWGKGVKMVSPLGKLNGGK